MLDEVRVSPDKCYIFERNGKQYCANYAVIKAILDTREHVANTLERRENRQWKSKLKKSR